MPRRQSIIIILWIIWLWRLAQIIFSVLTNPWITYHAGIPSWPWTDIITSKWYNQLKKEFAKDEKPSPIQDTLLTHYNANCIYGLWICKSYAMQYIYAGIQRLQSIQYIGKYINPAHPNSISNKLNHITETSPLWVYPYIFAEMLWPSHKKDHEDTTWARITRDNSIIIGERWIHYTCDAEKLKKIKELTYKEFIDAIERKDTNLRNPCKDYRLPHNLAFNYFQYKEDSNKAAYYYMVASFHDDIPGITIAMPAIVLGRAGENLLSATIWYDRFQNAMNQLKKIKDKQSDESKEIEKTIDTSIKKAVSEISLHILQATYPDGLWTGENISTTKISNTIKNIISQCDQNKAWCEILLYGLQQWWIQKDGILIYPIDDTMKYGWRTDRNIRWLLKK
jgi:hypothetical protein